MQAIEVTKPGQISIVERPLPVCKEDEVLIKVKAAGICGSDVHIYHGKNAFAIYPRVVGHEFVGEIVKVGSKVANLHIGDRIAVDPVVACGSCYACRVGRHNVCKSLNVLGVHRDGGYQEYVAVAEKNAHKLPENLSWEIAALVEPYTIAAQVKERGRLSVDDTVLICGAGPIGLMILQMVKMVGARAAIMDIIASRLERAKEMGADLVINARNNDMTQAMLEFTQGEGASLIYEATGNVDVLETCIVKIASPAGRIVVLGFSTDLIKIPQVSIMSRELEIIGTRLNRGKFPEVIEWFAKGLVQPEKVLTHTFNMTDAEKAFEFMDANPETVCKIVLKY
jgi:L-gulonate 5-dehydrogenase